MRQKWCRFARHLSVGPLPVDVTRREHERLSSLRTEGYRITLDGGRDSFFALSMEEVDSETAWLMSDTVRSLEAME